MSGFFLLDESKLRREMKPLYLQSKKAYEKQGDYRRCLDLTWEAIQAAPTPYSYGRYYLFQSLVFLLVHTFPELKQRSDERAFRHLLNSTEEPAVFRAMAAASLANISQLTPDAEAAADYARQILEIIKQVDGRDLDRRLASYSPSSRLLSCTVAEEIERLERNAMGILNPEELNAELNARYGMHRIAEEAKYGTWQRVIDRLPPEVRPRLETGGRACDCCGKTLEALGVARLSCCSKCRMAYYCSRDCLVKQWKAGHKKACREPDDIREREYMRFVHLEERDGDIELAKRCDDTKAQHWIVEDVGTAEETSVSSENLIHIRPAK